MNDRLKLIHGYFIQELTDEEIKKYNSCLVGNSKTVLVICKNHLEHLNVVNLLSNKLREHFEYKNVKYLQNQSPNNTRIAIYDNYLINEIKIIEKAEESRYLNRGYRKIILAGYYDPIDNSFIDSLGL